MSAKSPPADQPDGTGAALIPGLWRSVDWRFLLPDEKLACVGYVGPAPQDERRALERLGVQVRDGVSLGTGLDVVVVTAGHEVSSETLPGEALRPGGWMLVRLGPLRVTPWSRLGQGSTRAWAQRLDALGLSPVAAYWHAPNQQRCAYLVRLDDRLAVRTMLRRYQGVRFGLLKSLVARVLNRTGLVETAALDVTLVARRLPTESDGPETEQDFSLLPPLRERALARGQAPSRLLVTPWFEASRHVVCLYLDRATGLTCGVAKIPRRPWDVDGIRHEGQILRELEQLSGGLPDQAPEVHELSFGTRSFLLETALHGKILGPEAVRADPKIVVESALAFCRRLPATGTTADDALWFSRLIEKPLSAVAALVDLEGVPSLVEHTIDRLEMLRSVALPLVFEHGDLSHPNLLLTTDLRMGAVDWERSAVRGLPGHDLVFLFQYVAECRLATFARPGQLRAFDESFTGPDAAFLPWLRRYATPLALDPRLWPCLILATWARSSASLLERLGHSPDAEASVSRDRSDLAEAFALDRDFALWQHALGRFDRLLS